MIKYISLFYLLISCGAAYGQTTGISLDSCLMLAKENYPLIKQLNLLARSESYQVSNALKAWLPQAGLNAEASYQSDVTHLDIRIPGIEGPKPPNKDQYKINLDLGQTIYDGGQIAAQKNMLRTGSQIEMIRAESELYKIRERVMQLFFGNLLIQKQFRNIQLLNNDLDEQIKKAKAALDAKAIAPNSLYSLQAEQINIRQRQEELKSSQLQWLLMLSKFVGLRLDTNTIFNVPVAPVLSSQINRTELSLYDKQVQLADYQSKLNTSASIPKLQAYAQFGYANPALNFLENKFETYYIAGLRFNWNLSAFYSRRNSVRISNINKNIAELQKEAFVFNTELTMIQQQEEIQKYERLLANDRELMTLRMKIKDAAKAQWENGLITVSDYLRELNAEEQARTNYELHQIQYLQSGYLYNYYSGN
jgi:outer membrane protein TolC